MGTSVWRRLGAIFLIVVVLGLGLVPAAAAAPEQAPANAPSASCTPTYYRVRYGDNLTSIAWRYGVTVWQLQQWNGIANPNRIYAGQTLVIYRCYTPPAPAAAQSVPTGMLLLHLPCAKAACTAAAPTTATVRVRGLSVSTAAPAAIRRMLERRVLQQSELDAASVVHPLRCEHQLQLDRHIAGARDYRPV